MSEDNEIKYCEYPKNLANAIQNIKNNLIVARDRPNDDGCLVIAHWAGKIIVKEYEKILKEREKENAPKKTETHSV